jgi:hypothetical protein
MTDQNYAREQLDQRLDSLAGVAADALLEFANVIDPPPAWLPEITEANAHAVWEALSEDLKTVILNVVKAAHAHWLAAQVQRLGIRHQLRSGATL